MGRKHHWYPRASRTKEIIKIRAELNDIETEIKIQRVNKSKRWFFEKIEKISKPLRRLIKKKGRVPKLIKSEMKEEKLHLISQIHKGLIKITMNIYVPRNFKIWEKMDRFLKNIIFQN